jgi:hypothetical protein
MEQGDSDRDGARESSGRWRSKLIRMVLASIEIIAFLCCIASNKLNCFVA